MAVSGQFPVAAVTISGYGHHMTLHGDAAWGRGHRPRLVAQRR